MFKSMNLQVLHFSFMYLFVAEQKFNYNKYNVKLLLK